MSVKIISNNKKRITLEVSIDYNVPQKKNQ